jgi:hypothetical protein
MKADGHSVPLRIPHRTATLPLILPQFFPCPARRSWVGLEHDTKRRVACV